MIIQIIIASLALLGLFVILGYAVGITDNPNTKTLIFFIGMFSLCTMAIISTLKLIDNYEYKNTDIPRKPIEYKQSIDSFYNALEQDRKLKIQQYDNYLKRQKESL